MQMPLVWLIRQVIITHNRGLYRKEENDYTFLSLDIQPSPDIK